MEKIKTKKFRLKRNILKEECSWLDRDFHEGEIVFEYPLYTYGCIGKNGEACSEKEWESPFFELPKDALETINE